MSQQPKREFVHKLTTADGVPIEKGMVVWHRSGGPPGRVLSRINGSDMITVVAAREDDYSRTRGVRACWLSDWVFWDLDAALAAFSESGAGQPGVSR